MSELHKIQDLIIHKSAAYSTFPNATVLENGRILVAFRQAPDRRRFLKDVTHTDPASKGVFVYSDDNAATWSATPSTIYDHYIYGIQDPCLNRHSDGTLLSTFFMWKVTELEDWTQAEPPQRVMHNKYVARMKDAWTVRSRDGLDWDVPVRIDYPGKNGRIASVRGNTAELPDGSLLLGIALFEQRLDEPAVRLVRTVDKGLNWEHVADIQKPRACFMGEPNLYRTPSGRLACLIRTHYPAGDSGTVYDNANQRLSPLHVSFSEDDGRSWTLPEPAPFTSPSPFHVLPLPSGQALLTYGHRYKPYGIRAVLLDDELSNLQDAEEFIIRDDGLGTDLGYTNSCLMSDGRILVTYYTYNADDEIRYIAGSVLEVRNV